MINSTVDAYLQDGCGRCDHYKKPTCKVHRFTPILEGLRALLQASGLDEEVKWGSPCYTLGGKNVVMMMAFKEACALQFFKGAALTDDGGVLEKAGPNSKVGRLLKFRTEADWVARRSRAKGFIEQAVALERAGTKVKKSTEAEPVPAELQAALDTDATLRRAFEALTPGRRRSHILHVSGAKQSATRARRVAKCAPEILAGRGFNER